MSIDLPGTALLDASALIDDFARRGLPPAELWPMIDQGALGAAWLSQSAKRCGWLSTGPWREGWGQGRACAHHI